MESTELKKLRKDKYLSNLNVRNFLLILEFLNNVDSIMYSNTVVYVKSVLGHF